MADLMHDNTLQWMGPASSRDKTICGINFAPKLRGRQWVKQRDGETQFVAEGDLISG